MAAKKKTTNRKPKGKDDSGRIINLSDPYSFPGTHGASGKPKQGQIDPNRTATNNAYQTYRAYSKNSPSLADRQDRRVALRNMKDLAKNVNAASASGQKGPFAMGPAKGNQMSGRTVEFGTRSMLEAVRGFMRGGGGLRSHGK
jgi:hypothetical protein